MNKIENVKLEEKKKIFNYDKIYKIIFYTLGFFGVCCLFAQIVYTGPYEFGDDSTLFIIGLLVLIIAFQIENIKNRK